MVTDWTHAAPTVSAPFLTSLLSWLGLPSVGPPAPSFIGLVSILNESAMRRARQRP